MGFVLGLVAKHWKTAALLILAAVIGVYIGYLQIRLNVDGSKVKAAQASVAMYQSQNSQLRQDNQTLIQHIAAVNTALAQVNDFAKTTQGEFDTLDKSIRAQNSTINSQLRNIVTQPVPKTCDDTILYLIDAVKDYPQ